MEQVVRRSPITFVTASSSLLLLLILLLFQQQQSHLVSCSSKTQHQQRRFVRQTTTNELPQLNDHQHKTITTDLNILQQPSSVNLRLILEHQEALEAQCAEYQASKLRQLEQLRQFSEQNEQLLHLSKPLTLQIPAVCLFVNFNQIKAAENQEKLSINSPSTTTNSNGRLELVNWIFEADENEMSSSSSSSSSSGSSGNEVEKRNNVNKRAAPHDDNDEEPLLLSQNHLLSDYLIDPNYANFTNFLDNQPIEPERKQQERQVEQILADGLFQKAVSKNRNLISHRLSPVILVPGLLGSRLQARLDKTRRVNIFCSKRQDDWQDMWLSLRQLLPFALDCWLDNARLELDASTGYTRAPPGVETRVPDFGSVESVRHLDLRQPQVSSYFGSIIDQYEQLGYQDQVNLFAAPYDFRLAPQQLSEYFLELRQLIERAHSPLPVGLSSVSSSSSSSAGKRKVTLLCHSMGCTHLLVFLRLQSAAWRQSRIRKLIALSSPWAGAVKAIKALTVGDTLEMPLVSELKMRQLVRNYPSVGFLLPLAEVFSLPSARRATPGGPILVQTPERAYRAADLPDLLLALNLTHQLRWFKESSALIKPLEPLPDLQVDCIHSLNSPTPETMIFRNQSSFPNGDYELITGEGDGTVNFESLMVCAHWAARLPDKVKHKVVMNTNHVGVLTHKTILTHITDDVLIG